MQLADLEHMKEQGDMYIEEGKIKRVEMRLQYVYERLDIFNQAPVKTHNEMVSKEVQDLKVQRAYWENLLAENIHM